MNSDITYDCPTCLTHYTLWDGTMPAITDEKRLKLTAIVKLQQNKGTCKKCFRDDGIATTMRMDGMFTVQEMQDRFFVMKPCMNCGKFTKQDVRINDKPCQYCKGAMGKTSNLWASLRTFKGDRKLSASERKKMGA